METAITGQSINMSFLYGNQIFVFLLPIALGNTFRQPLLFLFHCFSLGYKSVVI